MIVIDSNIYCRILKILRLALFWREKMGYFWGSYKKFFNFFYKVLIFSNMQHKNFFIFCLTNEKKCYICIVKQQKKKQNGNNKEHANDPQSLHK